MFPLAAIIEEKKPQEKILPIERDFERCRVSEDILAAAYEQVLPMVQKPIVQKPIASTQETLNFRLATLDHERRKRRMVSS